MLSKLAQWNASAAQWNGLIILTGFFFIAVFGIQYANRDKAGSLAKQGDATRGTVAEVLDRKQCGWSIERMNDRWRDYPLEGPADCLAVDLFEKPNEPIRMQVIAKVEKTGGHLQAGDPIYFVEMPVFNMRDEKLRYYVIISAIDKKSFFRQDPEILFWLGIGILVVLYGLGLQFIKRRSAETPAPEPAQAEMQG